MVVVTLIVEEVAERLDAAIVAQRRSPPELRNSTACFMMILYIPFI